MKLYKKQVRPTLYGPMLPGFGQGISWLFPEDVWFDEDEVTEELEEEWREQAQRKDSMCVMKLEWRYVLYKEEK